MESLETRYDRLMRKLAEMNGHKFEPNGPAKKCNRLHKPKSHEELVRRVALSAGHPYGHPLRTVRQVVNCLLNVLHSDLGIGDCYMLRGVGVISSDVNEAAPRGKWKWRATKMLRAEVNFRSSRSLRNRMKKLHRNKVKLETADAEARARHRLRQMGLAKFGSTASIYRSIPVSNSPQQQKPPKP